MSKFFVSSLLLDINFRTDKYGIVFCGKHRYKFLSAMSYLFIHSNIF